MKSELIRIGVTVFQVALLVMFCAQFIPRKSKVLEKTLSISIVSVLIIFCAHIIFGFTYAHYCADEIQVREQHLTAISKSIQPPENALVKKEYISRKHVYRRYCMMYAYDQLSNEGIEYYENELSKQGYKITKSHKSKLEATNGDILIEVEYIKGEKELTVNIMFDDYFTIMSL